MDENINEKALGVLVIKQLLDQKFLVQTNDLHDRRVRQMTITQKGRDMLTQVLPAMSQAMTQVCGQFVGERTTGTGPPAD